ncbi:MAG: cysteine desulfurase family protein [Ignavibacteria bacterium]
MLSKPIYLDNHSTTRVDPLVFEAMKPFFTEIYGNAASKSHEFGWQAEAAVESSRNRISSYIGAGKNEIIFTSGATESINLALKGTVQHNKRKGTKIITSPAEHNASIDVCKYLSRRGIEIVFLKVDEYGIIDIEDLRNQLDDKTILVNVMLANNEIGSINPVKEIGELCKAKGVLFHSDCTQAVGKIPVNLIEMNIDLMSFSAHKFYGPKGIGALYIRNKNPKVYIDEQINGGGHERGFRSGTLNVPGIVGFAKALELSVNNMDKESENIRSLRDRLYNGLKEKIDNIHFNGHPDLSLNGKRLYNNLNVAFEGVNADSLMMSVKDIAVSSGSACSSASPEPSHVLKAIGLRDDLIKSSIRFGLGRFNTEEEIDYVIDRFSQVVIKLRV